VDRVLVTGAAGAIGGVLQAGLRGLGPLRLMDVRDITPGPGEEAVTGDVRRLEDARRAMAGCRMAVHLAAIPREADFESILDANIRGTYNLFEAARRRGAGASSSPPPTTSPASTPSASP
jgi:uronate dehydrogenase